MKSSKDFLETLVELNPRLSGVLPEVIDGFSSDSRKIKEGFAFSVLKGTQQDGQAYITEALAKGARLLVCEEFLDVAIPQISVDDIRKANALLADLFHDRVSENLKIIAVTGTNGKSSTAYIIQYLLNQLGKSTAIIGTLGQGLGGEMKASALTTPGAEELHSFFAEVAKGGAEYVVLEASSHGLDQQRLYGLEFEAVIFTNLSQDHLQYHGSMENYFSAKKSLFDDYDSKIKIVNSDDAYGKRLRDSQTKVFSQDPDSDCQVLQNSVKLEGTECLLPQLLGEYNIYNASGAMLLVKEILGPSYVGKIKLAMEKFSGIPGRMELFKKNNGAQVIVDFAHAQESLEKVICELRKNCRGKLSIVFGCGGDRDPARRYGMGEASDLADEVILTNDNPRSEDPQQIINDILSSKKKEARVIFDREQAIRLAWEELEPNDCLLIAGKGHEEKQIFKDHIENFSDRSLCRKLIEEESSC